MFFINYIKNTLCIEGFGLETIAHFAGQLTRALVKINFGN